MLLFIFYQFLYNRTPGCRGFNRRKGMISARTPLPLFLFYTRVYHFITSNDIRDIRIMQFYKDSDLPTWRKSYMYNSNSRVSVEKTTWKPDVT